MHATPFVLTAVAFATVIAPPVDSQTFDTRPLRSPAAFPANGLPTEASAFMAWLGAQGHTLPEEGVVVAREHLFAIISADVKERARLGTPVLPPTRDSTVALLFQWGHRLGLPGTRLVAQRLGVSPSPADPPALQTTGFTIEFDSLYTLVAEADGWLVRFPHYFMIGTAARQPLGNGQETSVAVLSTLFAQDSTVRPGASQATILLVSARGSTAELAAFWLAQLGLSPSDTVVSPSTSAVRAYRGRDASSKMTKELVVFAPSGRAVLAAYVGLDGTFETNYPHFVDLLRTLRIRPVE